MKQTFFLFFSFLLFSASCKKNKPQDPVDQLPPETQTGKNTFGCLIDGKVFTPKGDPFGGPVIKAQYQMVNGKQGFGISGSRTESDGSVKIVGLRGDSLQITEHIYELGIRKSGNISAGYSTITMSLAFKDYHTNDIQKGNLIIKRFDEANQIVSGTFWFDALDNSTGKIVQVREGRFDLPYVR